MLFHKITVFTVSIYQPGEHKRDFFQKHKKKSYRPQAFEKIFC